LPAGIVYDDANARVKFCAKKHFPCKLAEKPTGVFGSNRICFEPFMVAGNGVLGAVDVLRVFLILSKILVGLPSPEKVGARGEMLVLGF